MVNARTRGVLSVEIFWGLWLLPFGLLVMRSRFLPRVLGILLVIAGVAYVAHSVTSLLLAGHQDVESGRPIAFRRSVARPTSRPAHLVQARRSRTAHEYVRIRTL